MLSTSPTKKLTCRSILRIGIDDVGQIEIARRDLVQHRREEEEVVATDERHLEVRELAFLEFQRGIKPAEAAAENENASFVSHALIRRGERGILQSGAFAAGDR